MIDNTEQPAGDLGSRAIDELELELRRLPGVRAAGFEQEEGVLLVQLHVCDSGAGPRPANPMEAVRIAARHAHQRVAVEVNRHQANDDAAVNLRAAEALTEAAGHEGAREPQEAAESHEVTEPQEASEPQVVAEPQEAHEHVRSDAHETDENPAATPEEPPAAPIAEDEEPLAETGQLARVRLLSVLSFPDTDEVEVHLVLGKRRTIGRARASDGIDGVARATIAAVEELQPGFSIRLDHAHRVDTDQQPLVTVALTLDLGDGARLPVYGIASSSGPMDAAARSTLSALNRHLALLRVV